MKTVKLGDVCEKNQTIKWSTESGFLEYIDLTSVDRQSLRIKTTTTINAKNAPSRAQKIVKEGDVLFGTTRPTLDRRCMVGAEYDGQICSTGLCVLRAKRNEIIPEYIFHLLSTASFRDYIEQTQRGTSYPAVTDSDVKDFEFLLPSLEEQWRVVERLDAAFEKIDRAIELTEKNITETNLIKSSLLTNAFNVSYSKTVKLGDVCDFKARANNELLPYVGMEDVESGTGRFLGSITPRAVKSSTSYFDDTCVLYGKLRPYLNKVLVPDFKGHCSTEFLAIRPDLKKLDRKYLWHFLISPKTVDTLNGYTTGTRMPRADINILKNLEISLPSLEEQRRVVERLDDAFEKIDATVELRNKKLMKLNELKRTALTQAFSGSGVK